MLPPRRWLLLLAFVAAPALAGINPHLERARRLYEHQRFSEALDQLQLARGAPGPSLEPVEAVAILELLARCQIAEGLKADAERTFEELLKVDRRWNPDRRGTSPKILDVFRTAKARFLARSRPAFLLAGEDASGIRVKLTDPLGLVRDITLYQRPEPERAAAWQKSHLLLHDGAVLVPPPDPPVEIAWYLEGRDEDGEVRARLGASEAPRLFHAPPRPAPVVAPAASAQVAPPPPALVPSPTPPPTASVQLAAAPSPSPAPPGSAPVAQLLTREEETPPPRVQPSSRVVAWVLLGVAVGAGAAAAVLEGASMQSAQAAKNEPWADTALALHGRAVTQGQWALGLGISAGACAAGGAVLFVW